MKKYEQKKKELASKAKMGKKESERTPENHRMGKLLMDSGFKPKMYTDNKGEKFKGWSKSK